MRKIYINHDIAQFIYIVFMFKYRSMYHIHRKQGVLGGAQIPKKKIRRCTETKKKKGKFFLLKYLLEDLIHVFT